MPAASDNSASWNDATVAVRARVVPRYAWTTASIDVTVNDTPVLGTGGVLEFVGKQVATFDHGGTRHTVELTWGKVVHQCFPYTLQIDGLPVLASDVPIENGWIGMCFWGLIAAGLGWWLLA